MKCPKCKSDNIYENSTTIPSTYSSKGMFRHIVGFAIMQVCLDCRWSKYKTVKF